MYRIYICTKYDTNCHTIDCDTKELAQKGFKEIVQCMSSNRMYVSESNNDGLCFRGEDILWVKYRHPISSQIQYSAQKGKIMSWWGIHDELRLAMQKNNSKNSKIMVDNINISC